MSKIVQGLCLQSLNGEGAEYMHFYDNFPRIVRDRLKQSDINICAACLEDFINRKTGSRFNARSTHQYFECIEEFENAVKKNPEPIRNPRE